MHMTLFRVFKQCLRYRRTILVPVRALRNRARTLSLLLWSPLHEYSLPAALRSSLKLLAPHRGRMCRRKFPAMPVPCKNCSVRLGHVPARVNVITTIKFWLLIQVRAKRKKLSAKRSDFFLDFCSEGYNLFN